MVNRRYTLSKEERLSWKRYIDLLFAKGQFVCGVSTAGRLFSGGRRDISSSVYLGECSQKKFRRAVKRNLIKRQVREAYRVRKYDLIDPLTGKTSVCWLLSFIWTRKSTFCR